KRGFAAVYAVGLAAGVLAVFVGPHNNLPQGALHAGTRKGTKQDWTMFGGTAARNMVNTQVKGLPAEWNVDEESLKNVKWVADLGSKAYGGPIVAGGRVFVGTNNQKPRDKNDYDIDPKTKKREPIDLGILMAFNEA